MPAVLRARRGIGSRRSVHPRASGRRRVARQRAEGVDQPRRLLALRAAPRPSRLRRAEAPGHHRVRSRPAHGRRRRAAPAPDERRRALHRGLPRRRGRPRLRSHRRGRRGLAGRAHLPVVRARRGRRWRQRRAPRRRPADRARAVALDSRADPSVRDALARLVDRHARDGAHRPPGTRRSAARAAPAPKAPASSCAAAGRSATTPTSRCGSSAPTRSPRTEPWHTLFLTAPSLSIRGGTDEIQRNIIGERMLGLAEEPRLDRDAAVRPTPPLTRRDPRRATTTCRCARESALLHCLGAHCRHEAHLRRRPRDRARRACSSITSRRATATRRRASSSRNPACRVGSGRVASTRCRSRATRTRAGSARAKRARAKTCSPASTKT